MDFVKDFTARPDFRLTKIVVAVKGHQGEVYFPDSSFDVYLNNTATYPKCQKKHFGACDIGRCTTCGTGSDAIAAS